MAKPLQPVLWGITLPAVRATRTRGLAYIESGKYVPREDVTKYETNRHGWSTTTSRDRIFSASNGPVNWGHLFGETVGTFSQIAVAEVPELASAAEQVCQIAMTDEQFESRMSLLSRGESGSDERKQQIKFDYWRFVTAIIARAEATSATTDDDLLAIYLPLERARFATELRGDLLVPIALTPLDQDEPFELADGLWVEPLDELMQRARAVSAMYGGRVSAHVVAAATHAIVVRDIAIDNRDLFERVLRGVEIDLSRVDRVIQCLHIASWRATGYAQAVVRPADWADNWEHDLPAIWKVNQYHRYPDEFDEGGWNQDKVLLPRSDLDAIPRMMLALEAAPANVQLAARRAVRAMLRTHDEDKTLDATIGIEALMLGNNDRDELTHRMAQRAAAVLAADGHDPVEVYRLVKKTYDHRSAIVHGRERKRDDIALGDQSYPAQEIGGYLLRSLLMNRLLVESPWTPESLDEQILGSLARNDQQAQS